ncbi:uncharacterized protein BCR38DRAFT_381020, partial [Pseudomassariella vexata]
MDPATAVNILVLVGAAILPYLWLQYRNKRAVYVLGQQDSANEEHQASKQETSSSRSVLQVLYSGPSNAATREVEVDIVAVHGLGANVDWSWTWTDGASHVHWLKDPNMLPAVVPNARIMVYNYESRWHANAPKTRLSLCGKDLVESLCWYRKDTTNRPIVFIGHSLGGNVIQHGLLNANADPELKHLVDRTVGLVFLGCPFKGSKMKGIAQLIARIMHIAGSHIGIVGALGYGDRTLRDKLNEFGKLLQRIRIPVVCFFELKDTDFGRRLGMPHLIKGMVVEEDSACIDLCDHFPLSTDHLRLNKYSGPNDPSFDKVSENIKKMCADVSKGRLHLDQETAFDRLLPHTVEGASFDSHAEEEISYCLQGTRKELLHEISKWAVDARAKPVFWLNGMAGTGKSTISRTVAQSFSKNGHLGGSFFFKKGMADRSGTSKFFTTIAAQLVYKSPSLAYYIQSAIDADPAITQKTISQQFEKLILEPLLKMTLNTQAPATLVIIVDALDECEREKDIELIIKLFSRAKELPSSCLKIFITSRPELPIRLGFKKNQGTYQDLVLHEIRQGLIDRDLTIFLEHEMTEIKKDYNLGNEDQQLPVEWPSKSDIETLVKRASPLFIFAATICRLLKEWNYSDPQEQLREILAYKSRNKQSKLEATYMPVLERQLIRLDESDKEKVLEEFRVVVGSIVILENPLSTHALSQLLDEDEKMISNRLLHLHSVLHVPSPPGSPVRLFHLSFRNFLVDPERHKDQFWVDEKESHKWLATNCLRVMNKSLRTDICEVQAPGTPRSSIDPQRISKYLQPEVQYACQFWSYHLQQAEMKVSDGDEVCDFLTCHFLHWLEALSLMGRVSESLQAIKALRACAH